MNKYCIHLTVLMLFVIFATATSAPSYDRFFQITPEQDNRLAGTQSSLGIDTIPPLVAIAGYYGNILYAYDWLGDANAVLFERAVGNEWIGIGIGTPAPLERVWQISWLPSLGTHELRVLAVDTAGNYDDSIAPISAFTYNSLNDYTFTSVDIEISAIRDKSTTGFHGITRSFSIHGEPFIFAVYDQSNTLSYELIETDSISATQQYYFGGFNANAICDSGRGVIFASHVGNDSLRMEISLMGIKTHEVSYDLGTDGAAYSFDGRAELMIPDSSAANFVSAIIMESWIMRNGQGQEKYVPIPNKYGRLWYIGCNVDCGSAIKIVSPSLHRCCLDDGKYAIIKIPYYSECDIPPESLCVGRWDAQTGAWSFEGIYYPLSVAGFNTVECTVEFAAGCLHGIYAVLCLPAECGNVNGDGNVGIGDVVYLINYVFSGGPEPHPIENADVNCDDKINLVDIIFMVNYVFRSGYAPCDADGDGLPDC
jgi:hypothetical protein